MLTHLSLFSGIGGDTLAAEWAGFKTVCFVEIDSFCQKVLRKHWPNVPIVEDVNNVEEIKRIVANTTNLFGNGGNDNSRISVKRGQIPQSRNSNRKRHSATTDLPDTKGDSRD